MMRFTASENFRIVVTFVTTYHRKNSDPAGSVKQDQMTRSAQKPWHREQIKAAIRMSGTDLTALAIDKGLPENACRRALLGRHKAAELVIAERLSIPAWELWPDRWRRPRGGGGEPVRISPRRSSEKSRTKPPSRHCLKIEGA